VLCGSSPLTPPSNLRGVARCGGMVSALFDLFDLFGSLHFSASRSSTGCCRRQDDGHEPRGHASLWRFGLRSRSSAPTETLGCASWPAVASGLRRASTHYRLGPVLTRLGRMRPELCPPIRITFPSLPVHLSPVSAPFRSLPGATGREPIPKVDKYRHFQVHQ
jgi:hypothetical protein